MNDAVASAIGLSGEDTTDLIQKYYAFVASLNPAQQAVMRSALPSLETAAACMGKGTTAEDLNAYISERLTSVSPSSTGFPVPSVTGMPVPATAMPVPATGMPVPATGMPVPATGMPVPATGMPVPAKENDDEKEDE
jgi:hypothetical protein